MDERNEDLIELAPAYGLDAVDEEHRREIDRAVADAHPDVRTEFADTVRDTRETMAAQSATTAAQPPEDLLERILDLLPAAADSAAVAAPTSLGDARARRRNRMLAVVGSAAAAVVIAIGTVTVIQSRSTPSDPVTAQIMAADDVRTAVTPIETGGNATLVYSKETNAAMLVMNDVTPPESGSVYQMWLIGDSENPESVGIMDQQAVGSSTTAVIENLDQAQKLGFTVEPTGGSPQPTSDPFAAIDLT
ncbi:anti-sigma factor domain-containing protein [Rhodococcus sp. NPDC058521]|uniref:anti-sigma factor n=1 Tax=Rhodococcus sp. NPDC058521 TaxID=3346536 RepID=UPI0036697F0E